MKAALRSPALLALPLLGLIHLATPFVAADVKGGLSAIQEKQIEADVIELSADAYMGRSCPTPGYMRAAEFVAARFAELGLAPGGTDPAGEQPYFRYWMREATVPDPYSVLALDTGDTQAEFALERDWIPLAHSTQGLFEGELVFVGYAIRADKWSYKDFRGADLKGRIAIAFWHEPRENKKGKRFDGLAWTEHASARIKAREVRERGAIALILVHDPLHEPTDRPPLFEFPLFEGWNGGPHRQNPEFPVVFVSLEAGETLTGLDLRAEHARIDRKFSGRGEVLEGREARLDIRFRKESVRVPNVVGIASGTGDTDEAVVVAAHLDHAGADDRGRIWNGADDNASGTAALMAMAAAFAEAPARRDAVLIAMAAEEWGLWGSEAYAADPWVPMDRTVFMMNTDMVGRGDTKEIAVMGAWDRRDLQKLIKSCAKLVGTRLRLDTEGGREYWERSDQLNFFKHGVPALFVSEVGLEHEDYHQPSDTADKVDTKKAMYAAKLAFAIAWTVADQEEVLERVPVRAR